MAYRYSWKHKTRVKVLFIGQKLALRQKLKRKNDGQIKM